MSNSRRLLGLCCAAGAIVALVCLFASMYFMLRSLEESQRKQAARLERLEDHAKRLLDLASTPVLMNLETETLRGESFKTIKYSLIASTSFDTLGKCSCPKEIKLVYPRYTVDPQQPAVDFHPWQWFLNVAQLAACADARGLPSVKQLLEQMETQIERFTLASGPALFFTYPFEYRMVECGGGVFKPGWVSGFAQGVVLKAWVLLYRLTGEPRYLERARKTFNSFLLFRKERGQKEPWVSLVDENQYLWFEEYPTDKDPQFRVLNGHIYALQGLYSYYLLVPDAECLALIRGGITTVQRYFKSFRWPGRPNRYCLGGEYVPDYGPARSVAGQQWLNSITGDPFFLESASAFKTDMKF